DSVVVDGADAALRRARVRLRGADVRPRACVPLLLPPALAAPRRHRGVQHAEPREAGMRLRGDVREALDRPARRGLGGTAGLRLHQRPEAERAVYQARSPGRPDDGLIGPTAPQYR